MSEEITIRSIQHYLYCPHRWGLLEIEKAWAENFFVTKANFLHEHVHNDVFSYARRGRIVFPAIWVYCDVEPYHLFGVTDCIEAKKYSSGISIEGYPDRYQLCIVEYKPTQPKKEAYHMDDLMQVFAQKLCVDAIFGGDCDAELYYANTKKRVPLPIKENYAEYDEKLKNILQQMRQYLREGRIPAKQKGQKCSGCSLKDICMPSVKKVSKIQKEIHKLMEEES